MIIDADGHLFEGRDLWERYTPAAERDLALSVRDDSRGYPWITLKGESIGRIAWVTVPGHFDYMGEVVSAWRQGLPYPGASYDDLPLDYFDPKARLSSAEGWGVDEVVLYPQAGLLWDRFTGVDLQTARVNMAAWNRRAVEIAQDGGGRIHPVGHLTLDGDLAWALDQLRQLAAGGVRLAMFAPLLVDGKRLSHPDHDRVWSAFCDLGMTAMWHTQSELRALLDGAEGWTDNDQWSRVKVVTGMFQRVAPQVALCDLAANGILERFPKLKITLAELGSEWVPSLLRRIDTQYEIHSSLMGEPFHPGLTMRPSEYIVRQVKVICSVLGDFDARLIEQYPDMFVFGGDYPHPEGLNDTLRNYQAYAGPLAPELHDRFYGANANSFIHASELV